MPRPLQSVKLLDSVTITGAGAIHWPRGASLSFSAWGSTSAGSGSASIDIEVRNDADDEWSTMGTITLTLGTTATSDGFGSIINQVMKLNLPISYTTNGQKVPEDIERADKEKILKLLLSKN